MAATPTTGVNLVLRKAEPADLGLVRELHRDVGTWLHEIKHISDQWAREVPEDEVRRMIESGALYLALVDQDAAGVLQLTTGGGTVWSGHEGQALYVHSFAVRRRCAGLGLGKRILDWAADQARAQGKRYLRLDCMHENPGLRQYYASAGFRFLGQHPQHTWYALFEKEIGG
jgi:ribosomal protein S18 acetylase RimI-like enzyme